MFLKDFSLVLIDAENQFRKSAYRTPYVLENISKALNLAEKSNSNIYLVKYKNSSILEDVKNLVCDIPKVSILEKNDEDASKVLKQKLNLEHTIFVCGFNTNSCIKKTALSLVNSGYELVILKDCCDDRDDITHYLGLNELYLNNIDICNVNDILNF